MSDLLIVIDHWKYKKDGSERNDNLSKDIIKFIENNAIKNVALASYHCITEISQNYSWYKNIDYSLNWYKENDLMNLNQQTQDMLLNYKNNNINQMSIRHLKELSEFFSKNYIKNIYFAGAAWEICVRNREVGYINVSKYFPKVNIFTDITLVRSKEPNPINMKMYPKWIKLTDTLYTYSR
jgi:hypothetical protein